jgi:hypothetical protein
MEPITLTPSKMYLLIGAERYHFLSVPKEPPRRAVKPKNKALQRANLARVGVLSFAGHTKTTESLPT